MTQLLNEREGHTAVRDQRFSEGERDEMAKLGILRGEEEYTVLPPPTSFGARERWPREAISVPDELNEAYDYAQPASFSRALTLPFGDSRLLLISGTASVDEQGRSIHPGDFRAQLWRTYRNITAILTANHMDWHDIVRTTCYLRDIERDYAEFNDIRTKFFEWHGLDPLPASTGIQARLCREDLLVEIEAIAIAPAAR